MHIRNLKQTLLKQRLGLKKIHKVVKIVTTEKRKNYLVSKQNYHITKFFTEALLAMEMENSYYKVFYWKFVGYRNRKFMYIPKYFWIKLLISDGEF